MPRVSQNAEIVGTLTIDGVVYDLLQVRSRIWIIDRQRDVSASGLQPQGGFKSREELLKKYPYAQLKG